MYTYERARVSTSAPQGRECVCVCVCVCVCIYKKLQNRKFWNFFLFFSWAQAREKNKKKFQNFLFCNF